jgi:adenylate cyclase
VAVTGVLAIAIVRARRLLVTAATEAHAASELSRFFAPEVAGEIRRTERGLRPGDAVTRQAAVIMLDLRGFTRLAGRLAPVETMALLGEYHQRMVPVIQRRGGVIDKYLGDGIMATFGAARADQAVAGQPHADPTHAADALAALCDVLAAGEAWAADRRAAGSEHVEFGIALAVGPVLFGVTGEASRLEFTVIGEVVNLAAKLEKHCKEVGTRALVTADALELAARQGLDLRDRFTLLPGQRVAGLTAPVDIAAPTRTPHLSAAPPRFGTAVPPA